MHINKHIQIEFTSKGKNIYILTNKKQQKIKTNDLGFNLTLFETDRNRILGRSVVKIPSLRYSV